MNADVKTKKGSRCWSSGPTVSDIIMIDIACKYVYVEKNFIHTYSSKRLNTSDRVSQSYHPTWIEGLSK